MSNQIKTGLWETKAKKSGKKYYNGNLTIGERKYWVKVFKNTFKTEDKHPDLNLVIEPAGERR